MNPDINEVKRVVEEAYTIGVYRNYSDQAVRRGFDDSFRMWILRGEQAQPIDRDGWLSIMRRLQEHDPDPSTNSYNFRFVDVSGNAAVVAVDLFKKGEHIYTDYLSLLRFDGQWRIVGKIYHRY